jgi:hydroxymethylpyrimidine/phosphomethylpyrimidine kinase
MTVPIALTIAGSDSGGGAGIQADLKTFSALGVYGASVITALTAQNTREVRAIFDVDPGFIVGQIDTLFDDLAIDAVKIGMLSRPEVIAVVADRLAARGARNLVLDPVMVAKSGDRLLRDEAVAALRETLLPLADVVTPNLPEAAVLLGREDPGGTIDMSATARAILDLGARAVLLKGGHLEGAESSDLQMESGSACSPRRGSRPRTPMAPAVRCRRRSPPIWRAAARWSRRSKQRKPT